MASRVGSSEWEPLLPPGQEGQEQQLELESPANHPEGDSGAPLAGPVAYGGQEGGERTEEEGRPAPQVSPPVGLFFLTGVLFFLLTSLLVYLSSTRMGEQDWVQLAISMVSNKTIAASLKNLTAVPHVAGTPQNLRTAEFVEEKMKEFGWSTHVKDYPVLLSYPISLKLKLTQPAEFDFPLREGTFPEDPYSSSPEASTPFLAYSPSGKVEGEVVYVNYGRTEDFEELERLGVNCSGRIVLARYAKIFRGNKVQNAASRGAVGALLFSDPFDYASGGTSPSSLFPLGTGLPPSGAQRGSVFLWKGDPETPGWESTPEGERLSPEAVRDRMPTIPALPISWGNAGRILKEMEGAGVPEGWRGTIPGVVYSSGPGTATVELDVQMNQTRGPIRVVVGMMEGYEEPDKYLILGNHRDAWVYGAADPNSGTASLLEVARVLGSLRKSGWQPRISVLLCSWDAEEYALIGSTEWVEGNLNLLQSRAVAYLNVDVAVSEAKAPFVGSATPQLDGVVKEAAALIQDPDSPSGTTMLDAWAARQNSTEPELRRLGGGGSDFCAFLQHAGVASLDMSFSSEYPMYHSLYDDYYWMTKFGDPGCRKNVAITQLWVALALRISGDQILPFHYGDYAAQPELGIDEVNRTLHRVPGLATVDLSPVYGSLQLLKKAAEQLHQAKRTCYWVGSLTFARHFVLVLSCNWSLDFLLFFALQNNHSCASLF